MVIENLQTNKSKEMAITKNIISQLLSYASKNEVVYQFCGELIAVSNNTEKENKKTLSGYFRRANGVNVYTKHDRWVNDGWPELLTGQLMMIFCSFLMALEC